MKYLFSFFTLCILVLSLNTAIATCTCGLSSGTKQYPSSTLTPTTTLKTATAIWGGNYTLFNVVQGNTYMWSYCSTDGGSASWDTRLNLYKENSTHDYIDCNSDYCSLQSRITWTADFTGVVRVITNLYVSSSNPCGTNSTNATLAYKITGTAGQPDLTVSNQSLSSTTIMAGSTIQAYARENNIGTSTAGSNVISIHLSANSALTPGQNGDTYLNEIAVSSSISAGNNSGTLGPKNIIIPSGTTPGSYYVFFSADGGQAVTESDENNNFATVQITVQAPCTYTLSASSNNFPANGGPGSFTVTTQSNCLWTATTGDVWISTSSSGAGTGLVQYSVQANSSSNSRTGYINVGGKTFTITQDGAPQPKPDLTLDNISVNPNPLVQGNIATITCDFKNIGQGDAQNVITTFWLSNNCTSNIGNDYLLGTSNSVSVSANSTNTQSAQVQIPLDAGWLGTKYLKCWIDYSDVVSETTDGNNRVCMQVTINQIPGKNFELNSLKSHLMWPFYNVVDMNSSNPVTSWDNQIKGVSKVNNWYFYNDPIISGNPHHQDLELFAQDWNYYGGDCKKDFYSPITGTIIYIKPLCTPADTNDPCTNPSPCDNTNDYGNTIIIQAKADPSYVFRVGHLNSYASSAFKFGSQVLSGTKLGQIGNTGSSTASHAHCQLNQVPINEIDNIKNTGYISNKTELYARDFDFDAVNDGSGGMTGISSEGSNIFSLFPNPSSGNVTLLFEAIAEEQFEISFFNILGSRIYSESFSSFAGVNTKRIQLPVLPDGMYHVVLTSKQGYSLSKIVIVN
ncbi:MAG: T9SS type A sorting domain-containing protein [Bacteroidia bacterium]|nr:T9SS type A sorting domain-containing protein [Bacteroidia bacterium]